MLLVGVAVVMVLALVCDGDGGIDYGGYGGGGDSGGGGGGGGGD